MISQAFLPSLSHLHTPRDPHEQFAANLRALGGLSVEEFLNTPEEKLPPVRYDFGFPNAQGPWYHRPEVQIVQTPTAVEQLDNACKEAFGRTDALQFSLEFSDAPTGTIFALSPHALQANAHQASGIRSVLHVVKHTGEQRTYKGILMHKTEIQAKEEVAEVALREGALSYILDLEPQRASTPNPENEVATDAVEMIEDCFSYWRPGVKGPQWYSYEHGCALKVRLTSQRDFRVYSTPEDTKSDAKALCARIAIDSGVLEFIKFGDGQIRPSSPDPLGPETNDPPVCLNVQEFVETLPRPFPEPPFESKPEKIETNIVPWYTKLSQECNRGRADPLKFYFHFVHVNHSFGCILRIETPGSDSMKARTYLVEPVFSKKLRSKTGVCIQAMSEDVGSLLRTYIPIEAQKRTLLGDQITPQMRQQANQAVWPSLETACRVAGTKITLSYPKNLDKFGCKLKIVISLNPADQSTGAALTGSPQVSREWSVPATYPNRPDARSALLCESGGKMLQYIYSRGAFLGDSPHPTKGSNQTNIAATSTVPASLNNKQSLNHRGKEPVNVNVPSQVQTVAVPKSWKDWDKGTNKPNVELSYEPEPGEIPEHEGPVAGSSKPSSSIASKPLGSRVMLGVKRKRE
ncbi:hypothetical protein F5880DRAFT_1677117 [Lentinula raphanica]|nr:hypothetical protein F5880DRAFT_1677117 [Lentinula raphanica]